MDSLYEVFTLEIQDNEGDAIDFRYRVDNTTEEVNGILMNFRNTSGLIFESGNLDDVKEVEKLSSFLTDWLQAVYNYEYERGNKNGR